MLDSYCDSDEEVFFGPMTLKEVKKSVFLGRLTAGKSSFGDKKLHEGFKLVEAKSEPNLLVKHSPDGSIRCSLTSSGIGSDSVFDEDEMCLDEIEEFLRRRLGDKYLTSEVIEKQHLSSFMMEKIQSQSPNVITPVLTVDIPRSGRDDSDATPINQSESESAPAVRGELNNELLETGVSLAESDVKPKSESYNDCDLDTTLERMECMLRFGDERMKSPIASVKPEQIVINKSETPPAPFSRGNEPRVDPGTPWPFKSPQRRTNKCRIDETKTPSFKVPPRPTSRLPRPGFFTPVKTGSNLQSAAASSLREIVSPIGYYIRHSPSVPEIKNVRPSKPMRALKDFEELERSCCKENIPLPAKAYRPAKTTKLIDQTSPSGLPRNDQVKKMMEKLPLPQVIRHQRREALRPAKQPRSLGEGTSRPKADDSFANLSAVTGDVSFHVKKEAFPSLPTSGPSRPIYKA